MPRFWLSLASLIISLASALAIAAGPVANTPEAWLAHMLDAKKNGAAFKHPEAFAEWLDVITEPRFMTALAATAANPAAYPKAMADAIDPATARNWAEFTDPQLYLRWMLASGTPSFQQAIIKRMTDPTKMKRWVEAISRPDTYVHRLTTACDAASQRDGQDWLKMTPGTTTATGVRYRY